MLRASSRGGVDEGAALGHLSQQLLDLFGRIKGRDPQGVLGTDSCYGHLCPDRGNFRRFV